MSTLRSTAATVVVSAGLMAISPAANACVLLGCLVEKITNRRVPPPPASIGQGRIAAPPAARRTAEAGKARPVARDAGRAAPVRVVAPRPAPEPGPRASAEEQASRRERAADIRAAITHHARAGVTDMTEQASGTDDARRAGGLAAPDRLRRLGGAPPAIALPAEAEAAAPSPAPSAAAFLPPDAPVPEPAGGEAPAAGQMPADVLAAAETAGLWNTAAESSSAAGEMVADASAQTTPALRSQADDAQVVAASAATGALDFPVLALIFPAFGGALSAVVLATALRRILGLSGKADAEGDEGAPFTVPKQV
jgi:hypothetical protein